MLSISAICWLLAVASSVVVFQARSRAWLGSVAVGVFSSFALFSRGPQRDPLVDVEWLRAWGSRLSFGFDALSHPLGLFVAIVFVIVVVYARPYIRHHVRSFSHPKRSEAGFFRLFLAFFWSMLLVLSAQDLLLLFVALELTSLTSFLLIEFDQTTDSKRSSSVAFIVTSGSSLFFLIGVLLVGLHAGSTHLSTIEPWIKNPDGEGRLAASLFLVLGTLGKSAQVPLHFWLPRAMVAPTPVSAYLHSAALVTAGVFSLFRIYNLVASEAEALHLLRIVGAASIVTGSLFALVADRFKEVLAYSTVAQFGYAYLMLGLGGPSGRLGAVYFIVAHGLCKCALFLTAGAVTTFTGRKALSEVGGLFHRAPALASFSAIATLGLIGLPLTVGYFKDELLFASALDQGPLWSAFVTGAALLTAAYAGRFWIALFFGSAEEKCDARCPLSLSLPVAALASAVTRLRERELLDRPPELARGASGTRGCGLSTCGQTARLRR